jgi:nucleotide-binding universal stress UspA family protein
MHVVIATDGSKQSLAAARHLKSFADADKISDISVVGVTSPYASVAFADEISPNASTNTDQTFHEAAEAAIATVAAEFAGWGPKVHARLRSGSPATEIVKAAKALGAGLVVVASGSRGLSDTVLLGSTAQRVQHSAPCPVLVVRPAPRKSRKSKGTRRR